VIAVSSGEQLHSSVDRFQTSVC